MSLKDFLADKFTSLIVQIKPNLGNYETFTATAFTSLIVQIKLKHINMRNYFLLSVYIPHSSDKTKEAGYNNVIAIQFTSLIVQIKLTQQLS